MATTLKRKAKKSNQSARPARMNKTDLIEPIGHTSAANAPSSSGGKKGVKFKPSKL